MAGIFGAVACGAGPAAADDGPLVIRWSSGAPELQSADGVFRLRPRARLQLDGALTGDSAFTARNRSGVEVRSLQLGFEAAVDDISLAFAADLANHQTNIRNAYVAWRGRTPAGDLEVNLGNRLTDRGVEGSASTQTSPFLERNVVASALAPLKGAYGLGVTARLYGENWRLAAQVAGDDINDPALTRDTVTTTVRGHWNPVRTEALTVHLGAWGYYENFSGRVTRLTRNTAWGGQHFNSALQVSLGLLQQPRHGEGYGVELGVVSGPGWSFVEYGRREIAAQPSHASIEAWSASAGWFLTGEHPLYAPRNGVFTRMRPDRPVSAGGGGALELTGRIEHLDNTDAPQGGRGDAATLGVSWRPEEWLRLTLNASGWKTDARAGAFKGRDDGESVTTRLQLAF
ncbi:porin [Phenylobacterium sp.]|uniref:OprO/OprP family phosphate-selective porin n=1 Tax=Phenylobacterium sp. TaxID=1871053 RepID=UPI0025F863F0|nr:porin [Phenylobacterium sp.]